MDESEDRAQLIGHILRHTDGRRIAKGYFREPSEKERG